MSVEDRGSENDHILEDCYELNTKATTRTWTMWLEHQDPSKIPKFLCIRVMKSSCWGRWLAVMCITDINTPMSTESVDDDNFKLGCPSTKKLQTNSTFDSIHTWLTWISTHTRTGRQPSLVSVKIHKRPILYGNQVCTISIANSYDIYKAYWWCSVKGFRSLHVDVVLHKESFHDSSQTLRNPGFTVSVFRLPVLSEQTETKSRISVFVEMFCDKIMTERRELRFGE
jgi:hypothetical protein